MALVIIMMSAMPRLCGVNICLEKDQRSLASGFVGVKVKVPSMAEESKSPSLFRILPYNCLATSVVGLGLPASADEAKNRGFGGQHLNVGGEQQRFRDRQQCNRRSCAARFPRSLGIAERTAT